MPSNVLTPQGRQTDLSQGEITMHHLPVHPWKRHPHTGRRLRAVGLSKRGPIWPILGASPDDDDDGKKDADDDADDKGGADDDGKKDADDDADTDWKAKFEAQQRVNKSLERKTKKDAATIARLTGQKPEGGGKKDDGKADEPDPDKIREEAREEARREARNERVEDKIETKAAKDFADPEDVVAIVLRSHKHEDFLDADGKVDVEAITDALKEIGEKKPHLLAQGGKKFEGGADQGARKDSKDRPKTLGDAVTGHYQKR